MALPRLPRRAGQPRFDDVTFGTSSGRGPRVCSVRARQVQGLLVVVSRIIIMVENVHVVHALLLQSSNVKGPTSALTSFLKEKGITAPQRNRWRARVPVDDAVRPIQADDAAPSTDTPTPSEQTPSRSQSHIMSSVAPATPAATTTIAKASKEAPTTRMADVASLQAAKRKRSTAIQV